jgi:aminomethyltransferase
MDRPNTPQWHTRREPAVDDVVIYRHSAEHFMLVVNASNAAKDFEWINSHNRVDATVEDVSDTLTLLSLQGPKRTTFFSL